MVFLPWFFYPYSFIPTQFREDLEEDYDYEQDLKERQRKHLAKVNNTRRQPCLHDTCPDCIGTGVRLDGSICVHNISCSCPKCSYHC